MSMLKFFKEAISWAKSGGPKTAGLPYYSVDANNNVISLGAPNGLPVVSYGAAVNASRNIVASDFDTVLKCASGVTVTLPTDATLGITDTTGAYMPSISILWYGASAPVLVTTAVTVHGTARAISQYGLYTLMRIGANEWTYL